MFIVCAWCEPEGPQSLIGKMELLNVVLRSHGICAVHEKIFREQIPLPPNEANVLSYR